MDNTVSGSRRQDNDTPQSPSPSNVMSKSTNISQSESHRATTGPTLQAKPSYAAMARKALSDERLDSAAGASPGAASRRREPRPTDNQTTAHQAAASRGRQATTEQFDVELDARSRAGKVSTPILVSYFRSWSLPMALHCSLLSMQTTRKTFLRITYLPQRKLELRSARV